MSTIIGIDPGAKYTGVVVRDEEGEVFLASTYVRPSDVPAVTWASNLAHMIYDEVISLYPDSTVGVEGISDPKGYNRGKLSPINPKYLVYAGLTLGVIVGTLSTLLPDTHFIIVPPKNNGSRALDRYPECLSGRRPKELPGISKGAGTRNHEKSAYDVAGEVTRRIHDGFTLDKQVNVLDSEPAIEVEVAAAAVEVVVELDNNPLGLPADMHSSSAKKRSARKGKKPAQKRNHGRMDITKG